MKEVVRIVRQMLLGDRTRKQLIRYLVTGTLSFALEYLLFYTLFIALGIHELISNSVAITTVFWFNFLLNRFWSFEAKSRFLRQLVLYLLLFVFNLGMSNLMIHGATVLLGLPPLMSKVLTMAPIVCWNFVIYKNIIYKS